MKQKIIVLAAKGWSLVDEKTKEQREGVSLHYLLTDNLKPFADSASGTEGYIPVKQSITIEKAKSLNNVPGIYEGEFELRSSAGKTILALSDLKFIKSIEG